MGPDVAVAEEPGDLAQLGAHARRENLLPPRAVRDGRAHEHTVEPLCEGAEGSTGEMDFSTVALSP